MFEDGGADWAEDGLEEEAEETKESQESEDFSSPVLPLKVAEMCILVYNFIKQNMQQMAFRKAVASLTHLSKERQTDIIRAARNMADVERSKFFSDVTRENMQDQVEALQHMEALVLEAENKVRTSEQQEQYRVEEQERRVDMKVVETHFSDA